MVFKLEDSQIVIDGKSLFRGAVVTYIIVELCKSIYKAEKRYSAKLKEELKDIKREQKLSKKKQKVESN